MLIFRRTSGHISTQSDAFFVPIISLIIHLNTLYVGVLI